MAVKKTTTKKSATKAAPKKTAAKKSAPKATAPKKTTAKKSTTTTTKKSTTKKAPPKAATKKASAVKLTDKQKDLLKKVGDNKEGYLAPKGEAKALESLQTKKLIKRGAKDKASGTYRYLVTKTGEKHLQAPAGPAGA